MKNKKKWIEWKIKPKAGKNRIDEKMYLSKNSKKSVKQKIRPKTFKNEKKLNKKLPMQKNVKEPIQPKII